MKKFVALAVVSLTLAAGCTSQPEPTPDVPVSTSASPGVVPSVSSSPSAEPTPSPEPSPSPSVFESFPPAEPDASVEQLAIREGLIRYWNVFDKFAADPTLTDLTETQIVSTGEAANVILDEIQEIRENGHIAVGDRSFHDIAVAEPTTNADGMTTAQVTYCNDRSQVKVLDAKTKEDTGHRPFPYVQVTATLHEGADGIWRIAMIRDQQVEAC